MCEDFATVSGSLGFAKTSRLPSPPQTIWRVSKTMDGIEPEQKPCPLIAEIYKLFRLSCNAKRNKIVWQILL